MEGLVAWYMDGLFNSGGYIAALLFEALLDPALDDDEDDEVPLVPILDDDWFIFDDALLLDLAVLADGCIGFTPKLSTDTSSFGMELVADRFGLVTRLLLRCCVSGKRAGCNDELSMRGG